MKYPNLTQPMQIMQRYMVGVVFFQKTFSKWLRLMFLPVLLLAIPATAGAQTSGWTPVQNLNEARSGHTMTLLPDGRVLAVGGVGTAGPLASAELYDPATRTWVATGPLLTARSYHTATLLPNGKVLVAGGYSNGTAVSSSYQYSTAASGGLATAELYDPATGTWRSTGSLNTPRSSHSATLLPNGWVLVTGGCCDITQAPITSLKSAELYNPATETWVPVASMSVARDSHSATLLANGSVLVAGGQYPYPQNLRTVPVASAELYTFDPANPAAGTWQPTGSMQTARSRYGAAGLPDGTVLVMGGFPGGCCSGLLTAEVYDPVQKTWHSVGAMTYGRFGFTATMLVDGKVLAAGGYSCCADPYAIRPFTEIYDPTTQKWTSAGNMGTPRYDHAAILLKDGSVLVSGGMANTTNNPWAATAEIFGGTSTPPPPVVNNPPVAVNDGYTTTKDKALTVAAPGLLANDSDPDGDTLSASADNQKPPQHGTVSVAANGGFTYTPDNTGFTGTDSFGYRISDGKGGSASATVTLTISAASLTPQTVFPSAVTITTGKFNSGTMASFKASDGNTYDVNSAFVSAEAGGVTDWYASTTVSGSAAAVTQITMTYSGQYSKASVSQQVSLFNFKANGWDLLDTRSVGNSNDVTVTLTPANPANYISSSGEMRARVRGYRAGAQSTTAWKFACWANLLKWDVK